MSKMTVDRYVFLQKVWQFNFAIQAFLNIFRITKRDKVILLQHVASCY